MPQSKHVIAQDSDGNLGHADRVFIQNVDDIGTVNTGIASSGFSVSDGNYVELNAGLAARKSLAVFNNSDITVYVGPSGNGIANMYPLPASGNQMALDVGSGVTMFGLASGGTADIRILEIG